MADPTNETPSVPAASTTGSSATWRKISLPLPHLFPHLTNNYRAHTPGRPPSPPTSSGSAPITKPKSGRDWKLRRQKTYDSPGCLNSSAAKPPRLAAAAEVATPHQNVATASSKVIKHDTLLKREQVMNPTGEKKKWSVTGLVYYNETEKKNNEDSLCASYLKSKDIKDEKRRNKLIFLACVLGCSYQRRRAPTLVPVALG